MTNATIDAPIIVTGPGRCGTTWMQHFLSAHRSVWIHGQSPGVPARLTARLIRLLHVELQAAAKWTTQANATVGYRPAHYAASPPRRAHVVAATFLRDWLTGYGERRAIWGVKELNDPANPTWLRHWRFFFPRTRLVICLRDPFAHALSRKRTFDGGRAIASILDGWLRMARLAEHADGPCYLWQLDRVPTDPAARLAETAKLLAALDLEHTAETEDFARRWPRIHHVAPQRPFDLDADQRRHYLDTIPDLAATAARLGYSGPSGRA